MRWGREDIVAKSGHIIWMWQFPFINLKKLNTHLSRNRSELSQLSTWTQERIKRGSCNQRGHFLDGKREEAFFKAITHIQCSNGNVWEACQGLCSGRFSSWHTDFLGYYVTVSQDSRSSLRQCKTCSGLHYRLDWFRQESWVRIGAVASIWGDRLKKCLGSKINNTRWLAHLGLGKEEGESRIPVGFLTPRILEVWLPRSQLLRSSVDGWEGSGAFLLNKN